jgi:thiamine biosynthesis lipoprotein
VIALPERSAPRSPARPTTTLSFAPLAPIVPTTFATTAMGGRLVIHLDVEVEREAEARRATAATFRRIERWASRLTRHSAASDLSVLNAAPGEEIAVRPTLAAALRAGRIATEASEGLADITLLDARLAAEGPAAEGQAQTSRAFDWALVPGRHGSATVRRPAGLHFDLDGIGKGWIADRALRLLSDWPSVVVDADGDLAIRCAPGKAWELAVEDPRTSNASLAVLRLAATRGVPGRWGVATSGTSIHRWIVDGHVRHHLIDPRTGLPAATDVVQSTVIAGTTLRAEVLAKSAVIAGKGAGLALLDRARVQGALVLTEQGEVLALPQTLALLGDGRPS